MVPLAHTPLAKGLASGVYTASNPTGGKMGLPKYNFQDLMPLTPIHTALVEVRRCDMYDWDWDRDLGFGMEIGIWDWDWHEDWDLGFGIAIWDWEWSCGL